MLGNNYSKPLIFYYMSGEKVSFGDISIPGSLLNTISAGSKDRNSFFSILKFYLHEFNHGSQYYLGYYHEEIVNEKMKTQIELFRLNDGVYGGYYQTVEDSRGYYGGILERDSGSLDKFEFSQGEAYYPDGQEIFDKLQKIINK